MQIKKSLPTINDSLTVQCITSALEIKIVLNPYSKFGYVNVGAINCIQYSRETA
jgi:hypothetical protein